ncbi:MAG: serine--tRNA ligase, partial [Proteobacteria bacterium]|nr:serine--tRNA ligase [Pseudomonadota bacterium]
MLELRFIRENIDLVKEKIKLRGITNSRIDEFVDIDRSRRELLAEVEDLRNRRKTVSQEIAALKKQQADAETLIVEMRKVNDRIKEIEGSLSAIEEDLQKIVMDIPNICHDSLPVGKDDSD